MHDVDARLRAQEFNIAAGYMASKHVDIIRAYLEIQRRFSSTMPVASLRPKQSNHDISRRRHIVDVMPRFLHLVHGEASC